MGIIRLEAAWNLLLDVDTEKQIEILIDKFDYSFVPEGVIRIVVIQEPFFTMIEPVMRHLDFYSYVFTYHQEVLDNNPKARYFLGMSSWAHPSMVKEKRFSVSTVVGGKRGKAFPGYAIRHALWNRQEGITIPKEFYLSSACRYAEADYTNALILGDAKQPMFDCMFHICIENVCVRNCFSEKLVDCLYTRTIPIHYGTPNVGDYFNVDGIFECRTADEIIRVCNSLTPMAYQQKMDAIEDNYNRVLPFVNYDVSLKRKIMEVLAE